MSDVSKMSPTIFLDIDGVMWCHETRKPLKESGNDRDEYGYLFPEVHVEALRKIVDATGAVIVISSVWRRFKDVQSMWKDRGLPGVYGGMTPHIPDAPRGWEIYTWMQKNRPYDYKNRREFKNYVILDDRASAADAHLASRFVQTDSNAGLTAADVSRCKSLLLTKQGDA